jgi:hypothetical protein
MLHDKSTKNISEIKNDFQEKSLGSENILRGFKALKLTSHFSQFNYLKKCGYGFAPVLATLIWMVTQPEKTVNSLLAKLRERRIATGKDVYYRLKNNEKVVWRLIMWYIVMRFIAVIREKSGREERKEKFIILDGSTIGKTGKKIEGMGRVFDHVEQRTVLGFKILVCVYFDGTSIVPVDFSIHRERGKREDKPFGMTKKELRRQHTKKRTGEVESIKRVKELDASKIEMAIKMIFSVSVRCIPVDYVLCDSRFTCDTLIKAAREAEMHLIGMYKIATKKFLFQCRLLNINEIRTNINRTKRCKRHNLYYRRADVMCEETPLTLFFTRQGKRGKWKVLLTTDTGLNFVQAVEKYQIRWSIEVFFKEAKQLLNLGGCQSGNFDAQIADTTITMIAYILLAFRYRFDHYETMGALFKAMNADDLRQTLDMRLIELFWELLKIVAEQLDVDIDLLLEQLFHNDEIGRIFGTYFQTG